MSQRAPGSARPAYAGKAAVTGVGYTKLAVSGEPRSVLDLALEAARAALADAGLTAADVDGVCSYGLFNDSVTSQAVGTGLACNDLSFTLDLNNGGSQPAFAVLNAAMAVASGVASTVIVYRALNGRSGKKVGSTHFDSPSGQFRYPIGLNSYPQYIAMWSRRFMIETGATSEDLAAVVMKQREYSALNDRAVRRDPLSLDEYFSRSYVVEPFRTVDCTVEVDGAVALVVTSVDRAADAPVTPAIIEGGAWVTGRGSGLDIADLHSWPDFSRNCQHLLAPRLWKSAGLGPTDVDVAEIYDCFSPAVLYGLEALGFAERGEAGDLIRSGETGLTGRIPTNTHGGLLNEGYVHGMNTVTEAVLQVQGRGERRQVKDAEVSVATSGVLVDGSAIVFRKGN
ncbi:thiolase C-terminal domain-containing protein [Rhodococcus wratislaviensis]|uniref:thiolase C-terminal domain-containing protein n=1 Tax=Rhodococcus wratislaviensis TaxID=44752 RepID=UPI00364FF80E